MFYVYNNATVQRQARAVIIATLLKSSHRTKSFCYTLGLYKNVNIL